MRKFAFWRGIGAAYLFVFRQPLRFLKIVWPWLVVLLAEDVAESYLYSALLPGSPGKYMLAVSVSFLLAAVSFVAVSVGLYRSILRGEVFWLAGLHFGRRQWHFLGIGLLVGLAVGFPVFVVLQIFSSLMLAVFVGTGLSLPMLAGVSAAVWVVGMIAWFFASRMLLALPAAALDEDQPISRAWERSKNGNSWQLFIGSLCCGLPLMAIQSLVSGFLPKHSLGGMKFRFAGGGSLTIREHWFVGDAVNTVFTVIEIAILIAFYSYAYQRITGADRAVETTGS